jgi:serine/threonine protein kinase
MKDDPLIGRQLGNFRIKRLLGRGGMAQVYYGQDVKLQRPVAIKVIDARYRSNLTYAQRFVKEARSVARWRHENIIQIYYADDQDGLYYYAMEYVDGRDLAAIMAEYTTRGELMPYQEILRIGRAVANALDYAHSRKVIHRDVKPSNVLIADDGRVVLGDFGLALDLQEGSSGEAFGTPHYISPEQARRSTDAVPQSDLYSLGVVLYELLTGVVPFDDLSPTSVAIQHITQPPPPPRSINPQLNAKTEAVLLKVLSKSPQDRYQSGAELMNALEKAISRLRPTDQKVLPLPPLPASVVSGKTKSGAKHMQAPRPKPKTPPLPELPAFLNSAEQRAKKRDARLNWSIGVIALLLLATLWVLWDLLFAPVSTVRHVLAIDKTTPTAAPVAVVPPPTSTVLPVAFSPTATPPLYFTLTAMQAVLPTVTLSRTPVPPAPTLTASPVPPTPTTVATEVAVLPTAGISATSTSPYPNWKKLVFYYDEHGFYIMNASDDNRSISAITFERLDESGNPTDRFYGWKWGEYYPILHPGRCMRIEVRDSPVYMNPEQCRNYYLSSFVFDKNNDQVFWTEEKGSSQFRVLWKDEVVGLCEIGAGMCEVYVP